MTNKTPMVAIVKLSTSHYRDNFYQNLNEAYDGNLAVYSSDFTIYRPWNRQLGAVRNVFPGLYWQSGAVNIDLKDVDCLVVLGNPRVLSTWLLIIRARFMGVKTAWWGHLRSSTSVPWRHALRPIPMSLPDAFLFYTDEERREYRLSRTEQRDNRPVMALNNGLHADPIVRHRAEYEPGKRDNALLFIGRLTKKAHLQLALSALSEMGHCAPILHVIGDGDQAASLHSQAETLGLSEKVVWHGSILDELQISQIANRCKAFIYPGEIGLSLIHAMAYGLPALVHDRRAKHMPEIAAFKENETGITYPYGQPDTLPLKITDLLASRRQLKKWSENSIEIVDKTHNTKDMAKRFVEFVELVLASK